MSKIGQQIKSAVRTIAARNPLFVYDNGVDGEFCEYFCAYVRSGKPSCLIGQALWELGLIDATMEDSPHNCAGINELLRDQLGLELDPEEVKWLGLVQESQDAKRPWAQAITWADNFKEEMLQNW